MGLLIFAAKRLVSAIFVLFLVSILTFLIFFAIPNGNPALRLAGRTATPETIAIVTKTYGFDKPIYIQYLRTMKQVFNGSIQSYSQHVSVWSQIHRGFPVTFSLAIGAAVIWLLMGIVLGVIGALRVGKSTDVAITTLSFIGISAPTFVVGSLLLYVVSYKAKIFPTGGYVPITTSPLHWLTHLLLPWFTLAILYIGIYAQVLRSSVLEAMTTDAVRTANAKGLSQRRVLIKHVLRVSLIPIVSLWGLDFAAVIGGATIIVEVVFNLDGIGQYVAQAVGALDVPPVLVVTLLGAFFVVLMNAIVDVLYAVLDPRIRRASS
jgi:peptide/nickel transport system permease protein